jgi:hypothetical protein
VAGSHDSRIILSAVSDDDLAGNRVSPQRADDGVDAGANGGRASFRQGMTMETSTVESIGDFCAELRGIRDSERPASVPTLVFERAYGLSSRRLLPTVYCLLTTGFYPPPRRCHTGFALRTWRTTAATRPALV